MDSQPMHDMPPQGQNSQHNTPPSGNFLNQLETWFDDVFGTKAPQLPANVREAIVHYGPYVLTVILVISAVTLIPLLLLALGLGAILAPFAVLGGGLGAVHGGAFWLIGTVIALASLVLQVMALPGLFARRKHGWRWTYYASLISVVGSILSFSLAGLLGNAIGLYFLFQIKSYYK